MFNTGEIETCTSCAGSGECGCCDGVGEFSEENSQGDTIEETCPICDGDGMCTECDGDGYV